MKKILGTIIAMGLAPLPEISDYGKKGGALHMPWFSKVFSRNRFQQMLPFLHVAMVEIPKRCDEQE